MDARILYLHALTPVHTGTGQASDVIDLPVARETVTGWPYLPGSGIKGVLRDLCDPGKTDRKDPAQAAFERAFGPPTDFASEGAGGLWFPDAHLLCLPVRSFYGSFAWVTCPLAIRRWQRDHTMSGLAAPANLPTGLDFEAPAQQQGGQAQQGAQKRRGIFIRQDQQPSVIIASGGMVYLEDLDLVATPNDFIDGLSNKIAEDAFGTSSWRTEFLARFGLIDDDLFGFLAETATEVAARVRINEKTKTVESGGLWYEEAVPAEAIFAAPVLAMPRNGATSTDIFDLLTTKLPESPTAVVQIGGDASVGRGLVELRLRTPPKTANGQAGQGQTQQTGQKGAAQ